MDFNETFIDENIAELAKRYDKIRGANVNISRITAELIDGLKPVQRRSLYIMFQKDQGKTFRKLATISGDVFGRVHPHCLHKDTEFDLPEDGLSMTLWQLYNSDHQEFIVWTMREDGVMDYGTMKDIRITKYVNELTVIELENGSIKSTSDHQHLVWSDGKMIWKEAGQIKKGDFFVSPSPFSNEEMERKEVVNVSVEKYREPQPVFDFTVDGSHNAAVLLGCNTYIFTHNSPVAIEDAIVGMAQEWHNSIPLVEGSGNFGSVAGDVAGASRYIKARLSDYARACFFDDWKYSVVDMDQAYDEETMEPRYLPAKYPNVLLNGCLGIG